MGVLLALSSGMVVAFNPCGVGLLPSYLALLLSRQSGTTTWVRGFSAGMAMTAGFVVLFGMAGIVVASLGRLLFILAPITSVLMALFLLGMAFLLWRGKGAGIALGGLPARVQQWSARSVRWPFFLYGLSYGLVSLTCSLPVFLAVDAVGFHQGILVGLVRYIIFALGMGVIVTGLSMVTVGARTVAERLIHSVVPSIHKLSAVVMAAASFYLLWYWIGGPGLHVGLI